MTQQAQALPAPPVLSPSAGPGGLRIFLAGLGQRLLPWVVPVLLVVLWQAASSLGWLSSRVLPAPVDVLRAAWQLTVSGELWTHVKVSAGRALAG
ncbi:MAG: ABC transporter permease, partial [Gammaproteobacteria bacterium]